MTYNFRQSFSLYGMQVLLFESQCKSEQLPGPAVHVLEHCAQDLYPTLLSPFSCAIKDRAQGSFNSLKGSSDWEEFHNNIYGVQWFTFIVTSYR